MTSAKQQSSFEDEFSLGTPALVCRWRIAGGHLMLANRHLRALSWRRMGDTNIPRELVVWAKQHIEWTLAEGASQHPDGVLMLLVDEVGKAAMCVGEYEPLKAKAASALIERAQTAAQEAEKTGIAPETLWTVDDERLIVGLSPSDKLSGSAAFIRQLAETLGIPTFFNPSLHEEGTAQSANLFLVSDEHGVVGALKANSPRIEKLAASWASLFEKTRTGLR